MKLSDTPILKRIEKHLDRSYNAPKQWKPNMRPSFLGSPCLRKIYYNWLRVEPDYPFPPDKIRIFEKGDAIHDLVKKWLREAGLLIDYRDKSGNIPKHWVTGLPDPEFPVSDPDLEIKNAKMDGIGVLKGIKGIKDGLWIFEIKSINDKGFNQYVHKAPKDEHLQQAMIYAFLLEEGLRAGKFAHIPELEGHTEVQGVIYIYVNRENDEKDWKEFAEPKDPAFFEEIARKILSVREYRAKNKLPPKTDDFCYSCNYRDKCAKNYKVR